MMRRDGHYRYGSKNENEMFTWLRRHPNGFIIIPFPLMIQHPGITANAIEGALPMSETLSSGSYPLARPIRLYVKTKHVEAIKGLQQFLYEFTSERAISPQGYLVDKGFIPLNDIGRNRARDMALSLETIR
jgi:phosphate transport system substrate-binding protein